MNERILYIIRQEAWDGEYISVRPEDNQPYHVWWDGGNMWGNRCIPITWSQVESCDPARFAGINGHNWQSYLKEA